MTIINYASGIVNKLEALLTDDPRVVIYERCVFIVQATVLLANGLVANAAYAHGGWFGINIS